MSDLKAFLCSDNIKLENEKFILSTRFRDEKGKAIEWEIRAITAKEDEEIRSMCTKMVNTQKGIPLPELDTNKYMGKLAARCTVYPNLLNAELQDSYNVKGEDELLKAMLTPGEYMAYLTSIQDINGFNGTLRGMVIQAKN